MHIAFQQKHSLVIAKLLGIRARGVTSRPQRIPNAILSMVLDGVGEGFLEGRAAFPSDIFVTKTVNPHRANAVGSG